MTPPPKEVEWTTPKDLPTIRESLFGRSVRPHVDNGLSRVIVKPGHASPSPPPERESLSPEPAHDQPSTSQSYGRSAAPARQGGKAFCKGIPSILFYSSFCSDDISCLDYLTRLRLSKLLDSDEKWQHLARELNCQHMVRSLPNRVHSSQIELISICSDEDSSPSMILLDQFEVVPLIPPEKYRNFSATAGRDDIPGEGGAVPDGPGRRRRVD